MCPSGLVLLGSHQTCLLDCCISESPRNVLQRHHSHRGAFSRDTAFSDVPRKGRNFLGTSAGEGAGTVPTSFKAAKSNAKQGYDLFCSFTVHRSKSNLQKMAVLFGLLSKCFNV